MRSLSNVIDYDRDEKRTNEKLKLITRWENRFTSTSSNFATIFRVFTRCLTRSEEAKERRKERVNVPSIPTTWKMLNQPFKLLSSCMMSLV